MLLPVDPPRELILVPSDSSGELLHVSDDSPRVLFSSSAIRVCSTSPTSVNPKTPTTSVEALFLSSTVNWRIRWIQYAQEIDKCSGRKTSAIF
jgi:hypothetical protein